MEEDLNRDVCSLKAVLESEDDETEGEDDDPPMFDVDSTETPEVHTFTVLGKLRLCLERNIVLQTHLSQLLEAARVSLTLNLNNQERLANLDSRYIRVPRASINSYLRGWRISRSKAPYFIDFKLKPSPPNNETLEQMADDTKIPNFHTYTSDWYCAHEVTKLKTGVKQQNLDLLSAPIRAEMTRLDITVEELRTLQERIRTLKFLDDRTLYRFSNEIDWDDLAYQQFNNERSGMDCMLRYKNYQRPSLSRSGWKREEEKKLMKLVKENDMRNWLKIAEELGTNRSAIQCMMHYQKVLNPQFLNRKWTKEEDEKMKKAIEIYGTFWSLVAAYIGNRTGIQCANRYHSSFGGKRLGIKNSSKGRWQEEEDRRLHEAVHNHGDKGKVWGKIADHVQTRTSVQCRERWRSVVQGGILLRPWTPDEIQTLLDFARAKIDTGERMRWTEIGVTLDRRDDDCRRCWNKNALPEDLVKYKTLLVKSRDCIKSKRATNNRNSFYSNPSVKPNDIEDDMLSEEAKQELSKYHEDVVRSKERLANPNRRRSKKRKTTNRNDISYLTSSTSNLPLPPASINTTNVPSLIAPGTISTSPSSTSTPIVSTSIPNPTAPGTVSTSPSSSTGTSNPIVSTSIPNPTAPGTVSTSPSSTGTSNPIVSTSIPDLIAPGTVSVSPSSSTGTSNAIVSTSIPDLIAVDTVSTLPSTIPTVIPLSMPVYGHVPFHSHHMIRPNYIPPRIQFMPYPRSSNMVPGDHPYYGYMASVPDRETPLPHFVNRPHSSVGLPPPAINYRAATSMMPYRHSWHTLPPPPPPSHWNMPHPYTPPAQNYEFPNRNDSPVIIEISSEYDDSSQDCQSTNPVGMDTAHNASSTLTGTAAVSPTGIAASSSIGNNSNTCDDLVESPGGSPHSLFIA